MTEGMIKFPDTLDYPQIIFRQINSCREARGKETTEYFKGVEMLCDLMCPYFDDLFNDELSKKSLKPDLSNPYFNSATDEKKDDYARSVFRELIKLIHRSGFLPEKIVEGVLDERTIDAIIEATG